MRLSIIIPSYQQGRYIERTIQSVLDQIGDFQTEVFIVDGGSTDETVDVIRKYESKITWWRSHKDAGQTAAINEGLSHATGDIVAYINSDDYYLPDAFQTVADWWEGRSRESPMWLCGSCRFATEGFEHARTIYSRPVPRDPVVMFGHPWCPPQPSCFWMHDLFTRLGPFDCKLNYVMDVEWSLRCAAAGFLPEIVSQTLSVRWNHPSAKSASKSRFFDETIGVLHNFPSISLSQKSHAVRLLRNRMNWESGLLAKARILRLLKDFFTYPAIVFYWIESAVRGLSSR